MQSLVQDGALKFKYLPFEGEIQKWLFYVPDSKKKQKNWTLNWKSLSLPQILMTCWKKRGCRYRCSRGFVLFLKKKNNNNENQQTIHFVNEKQNERNKKRKKVVFSFYLFLHQLFPFFFSSTVVGVVFFDELGVDEFDAFEVVAFLEAGSSVSPDLTPSNNLSNLLAALAP